MTGSPTSVKLALGDPCKYSDSIELYGCISDKDKADASTLGDFDA